MADESLPSNWRSAKAADGKEYYFNELTGETSWTVPTGNDSPKPIESGKEKPPEPERAMPNVVEDVPAASPADPERGIQGTPDLGPTAGPAAGDGLQVTLGKNMPKVFVLLVASFVVMLQASIEHGRNGPGRNGVVVLMDVNLPWFSYAVALGTVSLGFTLALIFVAKFRAPVYASFNVKLPLFGQASLLQLYSGFMIVWWGLGAGLLTFHKPYTYTGNAYFACWAALIASMLLFVSSFVRAKTAWRTMSGAVQSSTSSKALLILLLASIVLFFASLDYVEGSSQGAWGLSCGFISTLLVMLFYYLRKRGQSNPPTFKAISAILVVMWIFAAGILTFDYPFIPTGNGFFASWLGLFASCSVCYGEFCGQDIPWTNGLKQSFSMYESDMRT